MYSSNKFSINLAKRVFACPRNPNKLILCLDKIALSNSGITVSSYPCTPVKTVSLIFILSIRLSLNSSLIDLDL